MSGCRLEGESWEKDQKLEDVRCAAYLPLAVYSFIFLICLNYQPHFSGNIVYQEAWSCPGRRGCGDALWEY